MTSFALSRCDPARLLRAILCIWLCAAVSGCGNDREDRNPPRSRVSGRVTLDNQPAPAGTIVFIPLAAGQLQSQGIIQEDGTFVIKTENGPSPGDYKVEILCAKKTGRRIQSMSSSDGTGMIDERVPVIPAKYNTATTLRQSITSGENTLVYQLQSSP